MAAYGVPQVDIGLVIGCDPKTLRLHFQSELEIAAVEANAKVAQSLFKRATEGNGKDSVTACIFWLKCRAGWRDSVVDTNATGGVTVIVKKFENETRPDEPT